VPTALSSSTTTGVEPATDSRAVSNEQGLPTTIEGLLYRPQFPKTKEDIQHQEPMTFYVNENGPEVPESAAVLRFGFQQFINDNPQYAQHVQLFQQQQHQLIKQENLHGGQTSAQEMIGSAPSNQQQQSQDVSADGSSVEAIFGVPFPFSVPVTATASEEVGTAEDLE